MQLGTAQVKSLLDPGLQVTDKEIQDALYYYYYDVQQTIDWLKSKSSGAQPDLRAQHWSRLTNHPRHKNAKTVKNTQGQDAIQIRPSYAIGKHYSCK